MTKTDDNYEKRRTHDEEIQEELKPEPKRTWKALKKVIATILLTVLSLATVSGFIDLTIFGIVAMILLWFGGWLE